MQAIAFFTVSPWARFNHLIMAAIIAGGGSAALAMELDHSDRIETAAKESGCALRDISEGKKRSGQMVYRVTCEQNGTAVEREVACKFNACTFAAKETPVNE